MRETILAAADRMGRLSVFMGQLVGLLIIVMTIAVIADSGFRAFLSFAAHGIAEGSIFLLLLMVFIGLGATQATRANFRVTILTDRISPRLDLLIGGVCLLIQIAAAALLTYVCFDAFQFSLMRSEVSYGLVEIPLWPGRLIVAAGFFILLLQSLADLAKLLLAGIHPYKGHEFAPEHEQY